jgi:SsrA-binding protein
MKILANNKKAYFNYEILDKYEVGIKLTGGELKSILGGNVSIAESFADIKNGEMFIRQCHIDRYKYSNGFNDEMSETRERKLLLHKQEIQKIKKQTQEKGITIAILDLHYSETKRVKATIGIAKGKKLHDKRETIKKRDLERRGND